MIYYELSEYVADDYGGQHFASRYYQHLHMGLSNRVWKEEDDGSVKFVKHREWGDESAKVDLEEFFWIKLKSVLID
jgi:hypothetical protein